MSALDLNDLDRPGADPGLTRSGSRSLAAALRRAERGDRLRSLLLAAPLLGLVKATRTVGIFLRQFPLEFARRPRILALIYLGAAWWAGGYLSGAVEGLPQRAPNLITKRYSE